MRCVGRRHITGHPRAAAHTGRGCDSQGQFKGGEVCPPALAGRDPGRHPGIQAPGPFCPQTVVCGRRGWILSCHFGELMGTPPPGEADLGSLGGGSGSAKASVLGGVAAGGAVGSEVGVSVPKQSRGPHGPPGRCHDDHASSPGRSCGHQGPSQAWVPWGRVGSGSGVSVW